MAGATKPEANTAAELWPREEARRLAERVTAYEPSRPVIFQSGFGPSGLPHLGTMAEILRPSFVRKAFHLLEPSRPSRLIVFIDDLDGLRKVPENVPNREATQQYLGVPVSKIPDPFGCCASFADHMIGLLGGFLAPVEVEYELKRASEMYSSGQFDEGLKLILDKHAEIIAIIAPTLREENRAGWSPFMPICPKCGQVVERAVTAYHPERGTIEFTCEKSAGGTRGCGFSGEQSVLGGKAKVQWKVDWALRWYVLKVDYELYGKDLTDSARLSGQILRVMGARAPLGFPFEMFLDEEGHKVSKSVGRGVTVDQWTRYAPIEVLKYFLLLNPRRARKLFLEAIPQYVDEYLDAVREYAAASEEQRRESILEYVIQSTTPRRFNSALSFGLIMNLVPALGTTDFDIIINHLHRYDPNIEGDADTAKMIADLVVCAINYYRDVVEPTKTPYTPSEVEREQLKRLAAWLNSNANASAEEIEKEIYEIGRQFYDKPGKIFPLIYRVLLQQDRGPRLGNYIRLIAPFRAVGKIEEARARSAIEPFPAEEKEHLANEQASGPLTIADFFASDWEQAIDACSEKESFHFAAALGRVASLAENSGDLRRTQLFRLIAEAASIGWESGASGEVFRPQATFTDGTRTRIPADYSDEEIGLLKALAPTIRDPEMRARISDIVWERARDYASAQAAIDAYLESAIRLEDPVNWSSGAKRLERALNLSLSIGDKDRKKRVITEIEAVLTRYNGNDPLWLSSYLMDLLLNVGEGDPAVYSALADRATRNARKAGDWRRTRGYLEIKAKWLHRAGKTADETAAKIESAETHVTEADLAEKAASPNYMMVVHHLELAISAFRIVGGQAPRVTALRRHLLDVQPQTIGQMKRVEVPAPDLTNSVQKAIQAVSGKSFHAALIELSLIAGSPKIEQLRQIAKQMASASPISSHVATSFQTGSGKTAAKVPGMKGDADENDPTLRSIMFRAAEMHRTSVAQVAEAARCQIIREHAASLADWNDVVCDNPFVPPGRERFFAEGLHFGLNGNFVASAHLLIPQIENSCRVMLDERGVIVSTHDQEGIEREMHINELILKVPEFRTLFGEDLTFDFRGLLIEQQGSNLRHGMAHGLFNYPAFQSAPSIYLWWLVLRILSLLIRERLVDG